ncbi:hypothetical protein [uncultured Mycobacterium sp.]|uniref:hypothetical protein n=1 Tax=uncultured Mycobacterium sp. TaxID=171292 RepID=UPI0035C9EAC9
MSGYSSVVNAYLVFCTVEAGFLNLWIIGYAVILLLCGQRGEPVVAQAMRWFTGGRHRPLAASWPVAPQSARRSLSTWSAGTAFFVQ